MAVQDQQRLVQVVAGGPSRQVKAIAFGFTNGSWFCMESTKLDNGKLLWKPPGLGQQIQPLHAHVKRCCGSDAALPKASARARQPQRAPAVA